MRHSGGLGGVAATLLGATVAVMVAGTALANCKGGTPADEAPGAAGGSGAGGGAATGGSGAGGGLPFDPSDFEGIDTTVVPVGSPPVGCVGGLDLVTGELTLTLGGDVSALLLGVVADEIRANGVACSAPDGTVATSANTGAIHVIGTAAGETFILDLATGDFGAQIFAPAAGIHVDLGAGSDAVQVRATTSADTFAAGQEAGGASFDLDGNGSRELFVAGTPSLTLSLGPGHDLCSAAGMGGGAALALPLTIYGGAGNDVLQGGAGDDALHGGLGDDTFMSAATADGADVYDGGDGRDAVDYHLRTAPLALSLGTTNDDGAAGEHDDLGASLEVLFGGAGDDVMSGGAADEELHGGAGSDTLRGASGADTLYGEEGDDDIDGEAGDDTLYGDEGNDVLRGGAGDDTIDAGGGDNDVDGGLGDGDICFVNPNDAATACELM